MVQLVLVYFHFIIDNRLLCTKCRGKAGSMHITAAYGEVI